MSCCQARDHVPRECGVHDVGKHSFGSRIKRVFPDRNIITVAVRFHCAVSAAEFYAILSPDTGKCDAVILLVAVQPSCGSVFLSKSPIALDLFVITQITGGDCSRWQVHR